MTRDQSLMASPTSTTSLDGVEALLFDVFGTVVDWLGSMERILKGNGKNVDAGGRF